jgi:tetratricopeptide (TPR) repeat protein
MKGIMILACVALSACEYTQPTPYPYVSYIPEMGHRSAVYMVPTSVLAFPALPLDPTVYYNRGWDFYQRKDYDRAIGEYSEAIRLGLGNATYYFARGVAYIGTKDYDKAISDFTKTIILEPNNAAAYHNRGIAYLELGKNAQAQADFDKAKQLGYTEPQQP